jgi:hypothetical protein
LRKNEEKLLIDSNSYFRLAQNLHPLLNNPFGKDNYCINILKECDKEYNKNTGLQNKFTWVNQEEYKENRKNQIFYNDSTENAIYNNLNFIKLFAREKHLLVSEVDLKYLATALELEITLITDDSDMIEVANEFEIKVLKSLELLKLMCDSDFITKEKVKEITDYWCYLKDKPKDFKKDCKKLFDFDY